MNICPDCGAVWDDAHRRGECGVRLATARLFEEPPVDNRPQDERMADALAITMAQTALVLRDEALAWIRKQLHG